MAESWRELVSFHAKKNFNFPSFRGKNKFSNSICSITEEGTEGGSVTRFFCKYSFYFQKSTRYIIFIHIIVLSHPNMMTKDILQNDKA